MQSVARLAALPSSLFLRGEVNRKNRHSARLRSEDRLSVMIDEVSDCGAGGFTRRAAPPQTPGIIS